MFLVIYLTGAIFGSLCSLFVIVEGAIGVAEGRMSDRQDVKDGFVFLLGSIIWPGVLFVALCKGIVKMVRLVPRGLVMTFKKV